MSTKIPEPVLITQAALITLHVFFGGGVAVQAFIENNESLAALFAFGNLATAAAQAGVAAYLRGVVVPVSTVVERQTPSGEIVAGPANDIVPEGEIVRHLGELPETHVHTTGDPVAVTEESDDGLAEGHTY